MNTLQLKHKAIYRFLKAVLFLLATFLLSSQMLHAQQTVTYSSYIGGSDRDDFEDEAVDQNGNLHFLIQSKSADIATTDGSIYASGTSNILYYKLAPDGTVLVARYLGGSNRTVVYDLQLDDAGNVYGMTPKN